MTESEVHDFIRRYVAMWHERDAAARRGVVESLFAADAEDITQQSISRGIDEITERVTRAHREWVAEKDHVFEPADNTAAHHHLVKFFWRMRERKTGTVVSVGLDVFVLNEARKVRSLYQFIEPDPR